MESRNARSLAASGGRRRDSDSADTRCARRNQSTGARYHSAGSLAPLDQAGVAGRHGGVDRRRRAVDFRALDGTARHWIVLTIACVFAFAALANALATRGRHFGWMALSAVVALALAGY